jgi:hypothetical protein
MVESLERALRLSRIEDAERIAKRAIAQVEELVANGGGVEADALTGLAAQAIALTLVTANAAWARWVTTIYARTRRIPSVAVVGHLSSVAAIHPELTRDAIGDLLGQLRPAQTPEEREALERLHELRQKLGGAPVGPAASDTGDLEPETAAASRPSL